MTLFKTKRFLFSAIYFFAWAAFASFALDFVYYSEKIGFSNTEIGLIFALKVLVGILFQPLFGFICDYIRSTRKLLILMCITSILLSICLPFVSSKFTILVIIFFHAVSISAFMPLLDNWAARECLNEESFHFGTLRLWGSIGYAIIALIYGRMTMYIDVSSIYFGRAFFFVITIFFIYLNRYEIQAETVAAENKQKPDIKALFSQKEYWLFFLFLFIFCFPINAANTFFPRLLLEKGSSNQIIALFGSINAIVEIPFLLYGKNLARKTGSRGLMLIGCMFTVVRMAGFAFAGSVPLLLLSHLGAAPYVGFFVPGFIYYSYSISPKNTEAFTLTSLQGLAIGFTGMLGSFFSGIIVDSKGIQAMFAYYSLICITGIIIFIFTSVWLKKKSSA